MRRLVPLLSAVAVVVAIVLAVTLSGSSATPPDTRAARLVPADALAWVNVSLDSGRPGVRRAASLPGYGVARAFALDRLAALTGAGNGEAFASAARAWIGDEAALAVLPAGGARATGLVELAVRRMPAARRFLGSGRFGGGVVGALVPGFLLIGDAGAVRSAVAVAGGRAPSLAGSAAFVRASAGEPPGRVLDVYASGAGAAQLLGGHGGLLAAVDLLLSPGDLVSASASLSTARGGARIQVHRVLLRGSGSGSGGGSGPARTFVPVLGGLVPAGAGLSLDLADLPAAAPRLLDAASRLGVGGAIAPLLTRLGGALRAEGVDVPALLALFRRETAVAVTAGGQHPALLVLTRTRRPAVARAALANLEPPLASLFPAASSGAGAAPLFTSRSVDGTTIHQLQLGPGLQVNYAVWNHMIGISTGFAALASVVGHGPSLSDEPSYGAARGATDEPVGSLVFLDLKLLLRLGEQTGLLHSVSLGALAPVLDRIRAVGLRSTSVKNESTAELFLETP